MTLPSRPAGLDTIAVAGKASFVKMPGNIAASKVHTRVCTGARCECKGLCCADMAMETVEYSCCCWCWLPLELRVTVPGSEAGA
jgi:hypothetical protein